MFANIKIIPGKENECRIIQDPMFIYIMREFGEEKNIPIGREAERLRQIARNIHGTMKYPYGRLESMRTNSTRPESQCMLYAIKELEIIPKIIGEEEYFRQTCFMDTEFMKNWNIARQKTQTLLNKVKKFGPGNRKTSINLCMIDRYIIKNTLNGLQTELRECVGDIFRAWQDMWKRYQAISTFIDNLGK